MKQKTYRVPKRVSDNARTALSLLDHVDLKQDEGANIAQALASGMPVGPNVLRAIDAFFADRGRSKRDVTSALMYGGTNGRDWANRCVTLSIAPLKPHNTKETVEEIFDVSEEELALLRDSVAILKEAIAKKPTSEPAEGDTTLALREPVAGEDEPVEELEEQIETALGLATQLDETVEKLAEALEDALEAEEEPYELDEDEAAMVRDALAEIGISDIHDPDLTAAAAEARERMATAALIRERNLAMAKMMSVRLKPPVEDVPESPPGVVALLSSVRGKPIRARLSREMSVIADPTARAEAYLQWAQNQMGVESAT